MAGEGLVSMTPTSISHSGTSASINADGGVDFSAITSLSLNGVFTSSYENYLIVWNAVVGTGTVIMQFRLRSAGSDASGSDYTRQRLILNGASITGDRATTTVMDGGVIDDSRPNGAQIHLYGPYLASATASRCVGVSDLSDAYYEDTACTHSLSTSYDGVTFLVSSSSITGNVHVFGYEE